jgi:DNA mismatch repair protein MutL
VDQHAAHERVLFEALLARDGPAPGQSLLAPEVVEVGAAEAAVAQSQRELLARFGFDVEPFGPGTVLIRAVPQEATGDDPARLVRAVLDELIADAGAAATEARIASVVCKRASVKAGQSLSAVEMTALLQRLERAREPLTCPHGRPTIISFDSSRLAREFGRG